MAYDQVAQRVMRAQQIAYAVRQHRPIDRLVDKVRRANPESAFDRLDIVERRRHQDRGVASARQCAERLAHLEAAHFGHHNVEDNEIGLVLVEGLKRRQAVFRLDDPEPLRLQYLPLQEPLGLVVIGDQDQRDGPLK